MAKENGGENFKKAKEAWEKSRERYAAKLKTGTNLSGIPI